ncbi:head-tail connector protein [Sansalvadorimonas verongulae]|uniref:head-tail connector protein n=1 Tax=Sansalvadorimonas verongulae TaxID=2172824 RepID=UPI0012BC74B6|nr:head-tail connector protein [Sansalvadorimonas verongulae]MTI12636.1 phage gp6-like head-tail connector protein [Sansalvadorimonas verongulae]
MQFLTIEQIKQQCRIEHDEEDSLLEFYGRAAESVVVKDLNRNVYTSAVPDDDSTGIVISEDIKAAMLLMVAQLYENREVTSELTMKEVPMAYDYLLGSYRIIPV